VYGIVYFADPQEQPTDYVEEAYSWTDDTDAPLAAPAMKPYIFHNAVEAKWWGNRDSACVTWIITGTDAENAGSPLRFQMLLTAHGDMRFRYEAYPLMASTLLRPGGRRLSADVRAMPVPARGVIRTSEALHYSPRPIYRRTVHADVAPLAVILLFSILAVFLLIPLFFHNSIILPLQHVVRGVRRVNAGERSFDVPIRVRDEIGTLAAEFNVMTHTLEQTEDRLQEYIDTLEERVEERTMELQSKNVELQSTLENLRSAQQQLIHAEKMASMGRLSSGIAHEIQNPMNFVINFADVAGEIVEELAANGNGTGDPRQRIEELRTNVRLILQHGKRASGIIRSMMKYTDGRKGTKEPVNLPDLLERAVRLVQGDRHAAEQECHIDVRYDLDPALPTITVVPQEMLQAMVNVVENSFDAVHDAIRRGRKREDAVITVSTRRATSYCELHIRDTGTGIPPEVLPRIFEPFYTTKPTGQGTGLGLSMSYEIIVSGHGGTMTVHSEEHRGTEIRITLPLPLDPEEPPVHR
jgi:signal transduction histidine kinase